MIFKTRKIITPISIKKIKKAESPNKLKKIKITDEIPIPIGKERLIRNLKLIVPFFFLRREEEGFASFSLKIRRQDKNPIKRDINIERKNII